jgi:hypothetical protein
MSYAKAMKWQKTHRKGIPNLYMGFDTGIKHEEPKLTREQEKELEILSFSRIIEDSNNYEYPIYVSENRHYWGVVSKNNLFGNQINSKEELNQFYDEYVLGA